MGIKNVYKCLTLALVIGSSVGSTAFGAQGQPNLRDTAKVAGVAALGVVAAVAAWKVATSPTTAFCATMAPTMFATSCIANTLWNEGYDLLSKSNNPNKRLNQFIRVAASLVVGCCVVSYFSSEIARYYQFAGSSVTVGPYTTTTAMPVRK